MAEESKKENNTDNKEKEIEEKSFNFNSLLKSKNLPLVLLGIISSITTIFFFYFSNSFSSRKKNS